MVAFANEEQGLYGGRAYAQPHAGEILQHVIATESDSGAGCIYALDSNAAGHAKGAIDAIAGALKPLGVAHLPSKGDPESAIGPMAQLGMAWAWLGHDGTEYFDLQHNADDTRTRSTPKPWRRMSPPVWCFCTWRPMPRAIFGGAAKTAGDASKE